VGSCQMRSTIVLSGNRQDAERAADWAKKQAIAAKFASDVAIALSSRVLNAYRAACNAFFDKDGDAQMLMLCLDLSQPAPRFELISDGEQARGTVASAKNHGLGQRQRNGLLDGLTCVSNPA